MYSAERMRHDASVFTDGIPRELRIVRKKSKYIFLAFSYRAFYFIMSGILNQEHKFCACCEKESDFTFRVREPNDFVLARCCGKETCHTYVYILKTSRKVEALCNRCWHERRHECLEGACCACNFSLLIEDEGDEITVKPAE